MSETPREQGQDSRSCLREGRNEIAQGDPLARIAAAGDILVTKSSFSAMRESGNPDPLRLVAPLLRKADLRLGNLEYPLTDTPARHPLVRHRTRNGPPELAEILARAGFDILGLANNHMLDCMPEGLADTVAVLRRHGIGAFGAGSDLARARAPALRGVAGLRFAFLAYTFPLHQIATESTPGCAPDDPALMREDVRIARGHADHVVVSLHARSDAGSDFFFYPSVRHQRVCRSLLAEGASAVLCHHVHALQGIEVHRGGLIAYGLGSLLAPVHDPFLRSPLPPFRAFVDKGIILSLEFDASRLLSFEARPTIIQEDLSVRPAEGEEKRELLRHLSKISAPLYDERALARFAPDRSYPAKLRRAIEKTKRVGPGAFLVEVLGDVGRRIDRLVLGPRRVSAFQRRLRTGRALIEPNPPLSGDGPRDEGGAA
jgi:poly-gamma-glutamate synthesis protein (capsule biosynthesis protein)